MAGKRKPIQLAIGGSTSRNVPYWLSSPRAASCAKRLQQGIGSTDSSRVDNKALYRAIKELRAELDRVSLAIQRVEVIAAAISREQQTGDDSCEAKPQIDKPTRVKA